MRRLLSHVDLRVRDRARARAFYDPLMAALGAFPYGTGEWTSYAVPHGETGHAPEWFGFTEEPAMEPGPVRISFAARTREEVDRVAALLPSLGALAIEGPQDAYGPGCYAVFFEDPDGNRLELVAVP